MSDSESKGSSGSLSFDITEVGNDDTEQLAKDIESHYKKDSAAKQQLSYHWERNALMLDGKQWLVYDGNQATGGIWKKLDVMRSNEYIPRPVTNYLFDAYQTLKSYVIKNKPRSTVYPNTSSFKDKMAAKIGDLCIEANMERLREQANYEYAAACLVCYGTIFKKDYWDTTPLVMAKVPKMIQQPQTDPTSGQVIGMQEVQAMDDQGQPLFDELPLGDCNTDIVEPYRIAMDPLANDIHKIRWIMEYSIQPVSWVKDVYNKQEPGYTGLASEVGEETTLQGSLRRFYALKTSSGVKTGVDGQFSSGSEETLSNSCVVKEYYERPSATYNKGRMVVVADGKCLYAGDSPYTGPELGDWHPYSECRWEIVPGRFWGKSPLDAACEIQKQINSIDAVIVLTRKTMAIPQKLIPMSAGIAHGGWTGRPGQEVFYRDTAGGVAPSTIPAVGVDGTVFQERAQRVEDLKTVTGAIDILKGDKPNGITAASALELLYEVGTGKLFPILDRWKNFVESSQKKQLKIIAKFYKEPRPDFIRLLRSKNSELSDQAISQFIGTDLYDNCNVVVEAGSNITKLQAAKKQELREAAQTGVLGLDQPQNRIEYQRQMGITGFDNDVGPDTNRAEWENSILDAVDKNPEQASQIIVLDVDQDDIHMAVLAKRMKEPSWMEASSQVQQAYMQHYAAHDASKSKKAQAAAMEALASGMPPQAPPSPNTPSPPRPAGHGAPKIAQTALASDLAQPGMKT